MKLHKPEKKKSPQAVSLKRLVQGFRLVTTAIVSTLRTNKVVSEDELKSVVDGVQDVIETVNKVLTRTLSLSEVTEFGRMGDVELGVKLERQQPDILYLVDTATTILERLYNLRHITDREHSVLSKYFRSLPVEHQRLVDRWEKARS